MPINNLQSGESVAQQQRRQENPPRTASETTGEQAPVLQVRALLGQIRSDLDSLRNSIAGSLRIPDSLKQTLDSLAETNGSLARMLDTLGQRIDNLERAVMNPTTRMPELDKDWVEMVAKTIAARTAKQFDKRAEEVLNQRLADTAKQLDKIVANAERMATKKTRRSLFKKQKKNKNKPAPHGAEKG